MKLSGVAPSIASAKSLRLLAIAVLRIVLASARFMFEPGMRNSNLLPVNAKGLVRLRSVLSLRKRGSTATPRSIVTRSTFSNPSSPSAMSASTTAPSSSPKKIDTIAGGASLAPRRWSLPALAAEARSSSW